MSAKLTNNVLNDSMQEEIIPKKNANYRFL